MPEYFVLCGIAAPVLLIAVVFLALLFLAERRSHKATLNELYETQAVPEFAHGIREVSAHNYASLWDETEAVR
jgi:hypothetical protein